MLSMGIVVFSIYSGQVWIPWLLCLLEESYSKCKTDSKTVDPLKKQILCLLLMLLSPG